MMRDSKNANKRRNGENSVLGFIHVKVRFTLIPRGFILDFIIIERAHIVARVVLFKNLDCLLVLVTFFDNNIRFASKTSTYLNFNHPFECSRTYTVLS